VFVCISLHGSGSKPRTATSGSVVANSLAHSLFNCGDKDTSSLASHNNFCILLSSLLHHTLRRCYPLRLSFCSSLVQHCSHLHPQYCLVWSGLSPSYQRPNGTPCLCQCHPLLSHHIHRKPRHFLFYFLKPPSMLHQHVVAQVS
jgi:hypothetical protein